MMGEIHPDLSRLVGIMYALGETLSYTFTHILSQSKGATTESFRFVLQLHAEEVTKHFVRLRTTAFRRIVDYIQQCCVPRARITTTFPTSGYHFNMTRSSSSIVDFRLEFVKRMGSEFQSARACVTCRKREREKFFESVEASIDARNRFGGPDKGRFIAFADKHSAKKVGAAGSLRSDDSKRSGLPSSGYR